MKFLELTECPFCGYDEYYTKEYTYGPVLYGERFDGMEASNEDMYENLRTKNYSGRCYCRNCDEYLGNKIKDVLSNKAEKKLREIKMNKEET